MTTVVIVDDQQLLRSAFRTILETHDITVVGEASDGNEAVRAVAEHEPDVVLMDVRMPGRDGLSAEPREIVDTHSQTRVLILTTFDDDDVLDGSLRAGAAGFLLKNSSPEDLVAGVQRLARGEGVLDPAVTERVFARATSARARSDDDRLDTLTEREKDVLALITRGLANAEIATRLGTEESTVKTHVSRILAKVGARDRVQAVIWAYDVGFAPTSRPI